MKVSIVTAVYNRVKTVQSAIDSVASQNYADIEHVVIDGNSTDGTSEIVAKNADRIQVTIREKDEGIYDALNKGIAAATGDVVGFLHADDQLHDSRAISSIAKGFQAAPEADFVYGDLLYIDSNENRKIIRYWKSGQYTAPKIRWGWMPPHPTFYLKRSCYHEFGNYDNSFRISADYELMIRMLMKHQLSGKYIPEVLVDMCVGGVSNSSLGNRQQANKEDVLAWRKNELTPPWGLRWWKPLRKLPQFFLRPKGS